jgi:hypothetical protein
MDVKKFDQALDVMKKTLGDAFMVSSIWANVDGQEIVTYNPQNILDVGAANALFNRITDYLKDSLRDSGFPVSLNRYYLMDLTDDKVAIVVQLSDEFQWGMLIDLSKIGLGMVLNIGLPQAMDLFKEKN